MNYWQTQTAMPQQMPQQLPVLGNKEYERTLLHPLASAASAVAAASASASASASTTLKQENSPQQQSPHYQYQQALPRIYQANVNTHLTGHTPLSSGSMPPLLNNTSIHESRGLSLGDSRALSIQENGIVSAMDNSSAAYQNSPGNCSDRSSASASASASLVPLRLSSATEPQQQQQQQKQYSTSIQNNNNNNNNQQFLYNWRSQSQGTNGSSPSNNIHSPAQQQQMYQMRMHSQPAAHTHTHTSAAAALVHSPQYQMPYPTTKYQYGGQGSGLPQLGNNNSPRASVTTITGKNIVNVLGSSGNHHSHNMIVPGGGVNHRQQVQAHAHAHMLKRHSMLDPYAMMHQGMPQGMMPGFDMGGIQVSLHVHGCHLCDKSFKRKSWLKRHLLSHSAERHFLCPWCLSRHKRKDNLLQHMKLKHSGYLVDELKKHNVLFNWEKSATRGPNGEYSKPLEGKLGEQGLMTPPTCNNIKLLLSEGVLNKEDVKRVLNKLIDKNNA